MTGGSSPQHAQNQGPQGGSNGDPSGRPGVPVPGGSSGRPGTPGAGGPGATSGPTTSAGRPSGATPPGKGAAAQGAGKGDGKNKQGKKAGSPSGPGSRIALRNWRISTRLVSLLALPVVAATTLGALRISDSMDDIQQLENMKLLTDMTKQATELAAALQEERDQSAGPLSHGGKATDFTVKVAREKTDQARTVFLDDSQEIDDASQNGQLKGVRETIVGLAGELSNLSTIRNAAYQDKTNASQTVESYHRLITQLLDLSQDMAQATSNPEMIARTRSLAAFSNAKEYASVQRAIIAAALPANNTTYGNLSENDRQYAESALESQTSELDSFDSIYGDGAEELTKPIDDGSNPTIEAADIYAKRVLSSTDGITTEDKRSYKDWIDDDSAKIEQMSKIELTLLNQMEQKSRQLRDESERDAIISGALILLVLGISLVGAFVVARSMIRSLRRLQDTATRVAQDRLPELVAQLSESDPQDVDTSVESVGVHSRDEIGQVAAAFDDVHREAVRLAAEQALLRGNVNAMFTNLSRRSQGLIQRQLSLISELESREADPDQLSSLFKLDHLATRMRRNGENLLVLAGEEPGRRWTRPVPLVDVLRAAASEVEQYERIELSSVPTTEVAGRVVNDLVHLLAELLENATSFSSPQTKVKVTGHALPDGRVLIEIHDTGIGLSPEDLAAINERLASPPTVDVSVSRRMGLFVVGRLSQRHGIRIQLRPSDSGGTTALVMLPVDVAQGGKKPQPPKPGQAGVSSGSAAAAAAAGAAAARRQGGQPGGAPLGAPPQRGQVGTGQGPRAALPGSDQGGRPGAPGGFPPPRPAPAGSGAGGFGQSQGAPGAPQGLQAAQAFGDGPGAPRQGGFGDTASRSGGFGDSPADSAPAAPAPEPPRGKREGGRRRPLLPGRGGPRAELPRGNPEPRTPSWSDGTGNSAADRAALDTPRGHEEPDALTATSRMPRIDDGYDRPGADSGYARQNPESTSRMPRIDDDRTDRPEQNPAVTTSEFARPDFSAPRPGSTGGGGQFVRSDVFGGSGSGAPDNRSDRFPPSGRGQDPSGTGQFPAGASQDPSSTGQFAVPSAYNGSDTGQFASPGYQDPATTGRFERPQDDGYGVPRPPVPQQRPARPEPESAPRAGRPADGWELPPAPGGGDGRTPLYDTLETNWFHGPQPGTEGAQQPPAAAPPQQATSSVSAPRQQDTNGFGAVNNGNGSATWRTSPNDELVRQAERVRQPAAGGVTTSGLPRRVPRANLVPGTAQQQQHQTGPQVSRAPDDVRGRLTNLRRGIAQGRQAGTGPGQTGSFPSPTHQQEH
ncbi:putative sensor with HAMP domain containing protein [Actinobacteria bacterium OK074]|nr:putative sensor with HAMP domain containing protein [Actinobacteria bacterium OK074]